MTVKLFVLGLPGSGKSGVARYIAPYTRDKGWESFHFNDYAILKKMFYDDTERKQFLPACHGGFNVIDFTVIDTALQRLEQEVNQHLLSAKQEEIVLIEFSRNDYLRAFQQFSNAFLKDVYFLYLEAETEKCKQRILDRINDPIYDDDYYVSEYIFEKYYHKDDGKCLSQILESEYKVDRQRVRIIDNNYSLEVASTEIGSFIDTIIDTESADAGASVQPEKLFVSILR